MFPLNGKNIVITGASSGIGRECAMKCTESGANVMLIGRDTVRLENVRRQIEKPDRKAIVASIDLSENGRIEETIDGFVAKYGKCDGLIHSAGVEKTLPLANLKQNDYIAVMKINTFAGFELCKILSKKKYGNEGSSFVLISSISSMIGRAGLTAYCASKGAINSGIRPIALELASKKMRVNAICPGTILTPLMLNYLNALTPEEREKRNAGFPLGLGECSDVANLALFLLSDLARWITGQSIVIDGGYTIL